MESGEWRVEGGGVVEGSDSQEREKEGNGNEEGEEEEGDGKDMQWRWEGALDNITEEDEEEEY